MSGKKSNSSRTQQNSIVAKAADQVTRTKTDTHQLSLFPLADLVSRKKKS